MTTYSKSEYEKYLNILEVNATDSLDTIKSAYRKLVAKYHPDKQSDEVAKELANEKLKMVNQAYEYICKYYDTYSSGQSSDYDNYAQEETFYNSDYSNEDNYSEDFQEDYEDYEDEYNNESTYNEPYEQENYSNQQNLYTQNADGCSITIIVIVLFILACVIVAIITSSSNSHNENMSSQQIEEMNNERLHQNSYNTDANNQDLYQQEENKKIEVENQHIQQEVTQEQTYEDETERIKQIDREELKKELRGYQVRVTDSLNNHLGHLNNINFDFTMDVTITGFGNINSCKTETSDVPQGFGNEICAFLGDNLLGGPRVFAEHDLIKMKYKFVNGRFNVKALSYRRDYGSYVDNIKVD